MSEVLEGVDLGTFQAHTLTTDQSPVKGIDGLRFPLLGLFGEVGSLLAELKKRQRDGAAHLAYEKVVMEEFGDVLWYFSNILSRCGLALPVMVEAIAPPSATLPCSDTGWNFRRIQHPVLGRPQPPVYEHDLIRLAGKVGVLLDDVASGGIGLGGDSLSVRLKEILQALVKAADDAGVCLDQAILLNQAKTLGRWPVDRTFPRLFDEDEEHEEQLPRRIEIEIRETVRGSNAYVRLRCNGINIGDRLTDNRAEEDDYRFHDVFHLANAAVLGWSPVIRALFRVKRKSKPKVDETQDGARAIVIEEGISALVFNHASRLSYFETISMLDFSLLKAVQNVVSGFEVETCPLWLWEKAILDGYAVFRHLRRSRSGLVIADLKRRSITVQPVD